MTERSVVYGYIKNTADNVTGHREANQRAVQSLPPAESWPVLSREMFAAFEDNGDLQDNDIHFHTDIMHFGAAYQGVEYEWSLWLQQFEKLLEKMYWVSALVHLETELSGKHSFTWQAEGEHHEPGQKVTIMRGEWGIAVGD